MRNPPHLPKKLAQRVHAKRRAWERYGIQLNQNEFWDICLAAQAASILREQTNNLDERAVWWRGLYFRVMFNTTTKEIVTFLSLDNGHGRTDKL